MNKNVKNVRVDRIANLIQEYDIEQVIHIKGRENCLADYLSRYPGVEDDELNDIEYGLEKQMFSTMKTTMILIRILIRSLQLETARETNSELSEGNVQKSDDEGEEPIPQIIPKNFSSKHFDITILKTEQQHDPAIQQIIQNLNNHPDFTMKDGIIYKLLNRIHNTGTKTQIVYLPTSMIKPLLYAVHNDPMTGGHFSTDRTFDKIKNKFWWPNMKNSISLHVQACLECQVHNINRQKRFCKFL
ncbi:unnamed protein product [Didymodactylos carnosus]|nr:unnamed protein product [Didymodactylos carnosus]CAF4367620.1 unnamed protein product [Didymodactylos carnosus]